MAGPSGDVTMTKLLPSPCVATILIGDPASRNWMMSVEPVTPIRTSPTITALSRSGPPRNGRNSAFTPCSLKNPFSAAMMTGPASP